MKDFEGFDNVQNETPDTHQNAVHDPLGFEKGDVPAHDETDEAAHGVRIIRFKWS